MAIIIFRDQDSYERAMDILDEIDDWIRVIRSPNAADPRPWHLVADQHLPLLQRWFLQERIAYDVLRNGRARSSEPPFGPPAPDTDAE